MAPVAQENKIPYLLEHPALDDITRRGTDLVFRLQPTTGMFFGANGSLMCNNYPAVIQCKSWEIEPGGQLLRTFTDSHTGTPVEVKTYWTLLSKSGETLQVSQTSSNNQGATILTVMVR